MKKTANYHYLSYVLWPLNALDREAEAAVGMIDPNNHEEVTEVFRTHLLPVYEALLPDKQTGIRDALQYYLSTGRAPFAELFREQQESPLSEPDDPKLAFVWLWEVLFPGESYALASCDDWLERNDRSEVF